jgi:hypothetical protein
MTYKPIKINCDTALAPCLEDEKLQIFVDDKTCWEFNLDDARKFYMMHIGTDATAPPYVDTGCTLQIMDGNKTQFLFEFPMNQSAKALEWFNIIHEILR